METYFNLVLGDCREHLPGLETESVHLVVTDPPYFLDGLLTVRKNLA